MKLLFHAKIIHHARRGFVVGGLWCVLIGTGCGGGSAITDVRMSAQKRPDLDREHAAKGKLTIPADEPFNYPFFHSGQEGVSAHGEAKAVGKNGASCRAESTGEGTAWGEFQLGYCFDNESGEALDAVLKITLTTAASATPSAASPDNKDNKNVKPTATGTVVFFVKDSNGLVLRQEQLLTTDLNRGLSSTNNKHSLVYDARFEPDRGYYVVVAGRIDVTGVTGQTAGLALDVSDAAFEINWRGAKQGTGTEAKSEGSATEAKDQPEAKK